MNIRTGLAVIAAAAAFTGAQTMSFGGEYEIAAYYFPSYHPNPVYSAERGEGWTEWELMKQAGPRFPGHDQPKVPAWGYEDESDPAVMARKIDAAADHGVTCFLYDWYWHDSGPFIERGLEQGFLKAPNRDRMKFALMWANHDWIDIFPMSAGVKPKVIHPGPVTPETFVKLTDHVIKTYFSQPNHLRIGGKCYFSVYELMTLVKGFGGIDNTRAALDGFRERAAAAGTPVHLNAVVWGVQLLPNEQTIKNPEEMLAKLGFDSVTSYCWIHHAVPKGFPKADYTAWMNASTPLWEGFVKRWPVPYYPNVSMGWDASPRTNQKDTFEDRGYTFTPVVVDNTPANFREALRRAKEFLDAQPPERRILTINAWNEWTEGSYLEPDIKNGMGYLEAIRDVFGPANGAKKGK